MGYLLLYDVKKSAVKGGPLFANLKGTKSF